MASKKHHRTHKDVVTWMIESGWTSHPYVKDFYSKQLKQRKPVKPRG